MAAESMEYCGTCGVHCDVMGILLDGDCAMCVVANQRLTASANNLAVASMYIAEAAKKKAEGDISASDDGIMDDEDEEDDDDASSDDDWLDWSNDDAVLAWMMQQRRALRGSDISEAMWAKQLDIWGDLCEQHGLFNSAGFVHSTHDTTPGADSDDWTDSDDASGSA
jgi:hypothetical protein